MTADRTPRTITWSKVVAVLHAERAAAIAQRAANGDPEPVPAPR